MFGQLMLLGIGSIVNPTVIAVAGVVLALVIAIGGFLIYRSGGKKGAKTATGTGTSDWQRQSQQGGAAGGWHPQSMGNDAPAWNSQGIQGGQQAGGWNGQNMTQQPQQPAWGGMQNGQQPASPWGAQGASQQPAASPWGSQQGQGNIAGPGSPQQQPAWGGMQNSQQPASPWGAQGNQNAPQRSASPWEAQSNQGNRTPWEGNQAPATQEPWGQSASPSPRAGTQQPQTAFGEPSSGSSWNQPGFGGNGQNGQSAQGGQADSWGAPQYAPQGINNAANGFASVPAASPPQAPSWQQGGFGQMGPGGQGMRQDQGAFYGGTDGSFGSNDGDKTMLRSTGGLGLVRVEEGKEPGREYKIVKDSLSIGRSRESDIFLEDLAVSRLHASVVNMGNGNYALKDEGSANGTKVNGQLVNKYQTYPLQEGDRIQLGQTVLVFARG